MADSQLHALTEATTIADTDEFYMVKDPFGPGYDRRVKYQTLRTSILTSRGYGLQFGTVNNNPADSTTYYFGGVFGSGMGTIDGQRRIYIPGGTSVKRIWMAFTGAIGSSETSSVYFRLNSTTDTLIGTFALDASPKVVFNTSLNISVAPGNYFEIKWVTPAWVTNPTAVSVNGVVWIE